MYDYSLIKTIHLGSVILSLGGFLLRSWWRFFKPAMLQHRLVKIVPHFVDTLLLVSAILLTRLIQQYPFTHGWLTAKLFLLLLYIVAGHFTLKTGLSRKHSFTAFLLAIASFASILVIALRHVHIL